MPTHLYALRCVTHLHAGSGDSGLGVIDKLVQRDPTDKLPTVFSSSLKGALREHFEKVANAKPFINQLFGAGTQGKEEKFASGSLVFGEARLLSLPVRSDKHPYFCVTSPQLLKAFTDMANLYGVTLPLLDSIKPLAAYEATGEINHVFLTQLDGAALEEQDRAGRFLNMELFAEDSVKDHKTWRLAVSHLLGDPFALVDHAFFSDLSEDLPVIARNSLENGVSRNLWYEQIVPRESRFFFALRGSESDLETFRSVINGNLVQVGGNATIGYGQVLFTHLN